jgi:exo-beta-1,3-glucanase (GH17 family)
MKRLKKITVFLLIFSFILPFIPTQIVSADTYGDWEYVLLSDGSVKLTRYLGTAKDIQIPGEINSLTVTEIGNGTKALIPTDTNSITIAEGIKTIHSKAFKGCAYLTELTLPQSFLGFGEYVFDGCQRMTHIVMQPGAKTSIGRWELGGLLNLASIVIPPTITSVDRYIFENQNGYNYTREFLLIAEPGSAIETFTKQYFRNVPIVSSSNWVDYEVLRVNEGVVAFGDSGSPIDTFLKTDDGSINHLPYGEKKGIVFVPSIEKGNFLTMNIPSTVTNPISITGIASLTGGQFDLYVGSDKVKTVTVGSDLFYQTELTIPKNVSGKHVITAKIPGSNKSISQTVDFIANAPRLTMFQATHNSAVPINLIRSDGRLDILYFVPGRPITFEIELASNTDITSISEVNIVSVDRFGNLGERKLSTIKTSDGKWVAIDPQADPSFYLSNQLAVECVWQSGSNNNKLANLGFIPDLENYDKSRLLPDSAGVVAYGYAPGNASENSSKETLNPNLGMIELAPGLFVNSQNGGKTWDIIVEESAVGKTHVFWAQGGKYKEYIFAQFSQPGTYKIGTQHLGLSHLSYQGLLEESSSVKDIIGYGKYRLIIDPSGYVYEAVPSNRLKGVTTTIYYQDDNANPAIWSEAKEYEQENPLTSNEKGVYGWDVPEGVWQVKFELDGYETAYSDWLPVPPEHKDVNVGLVSKANPTVTQVNGYSDAIEIMFSKYMIPESLRPEQFTVKQNGIAIPGTITFLNLENNYDNSASYASAIRFIPEQTLSGSIDITVDQTVTSYADVSMAASYTKTVTIVPEPKTMEANGISIDSNQSGDIIVTISPAQAAVGKKVTALSSSPNIASVEDAIVDANGQAIIKTNGLLTGLATITLSLEGTMLSKRVSVSVAPPLSRREALGQEDFSLDNNDIVDAFSAITSCEFKSTQNSIADARAYVADTIRQLPLNDVAFSVADGEFTPATAGTATAPKGINGSYCFTVTLSKGGGITRTTDELTLELVAQRANVEDYSDFDLKFPGVRKDVTNAAKYSINYSPYLNGLRPGGSELPKETSVRAQLTMLSQNFDSVRFFTAEDSLLFMYDIAKELDLDVIGTAWIDNTMTEAQIYAQLDNLIELANAGKVCIASVGSEVLYRKDKTPKQLLTYLNYVKGKITTSVPVTYMDVSEWFNGSKNAANPGLDELNAACDLILFSHYPVFSNNYNNTEIITNNGGVIPYAINELKNAYNDVKSAQGLDVLCIMAETGWPSAGTSAIGAATPNMENARAYWNVVQTWAKEKNINVFYFSAFDEQWKSTEGSLDGRHWGLFYETGQTKEGFTDLFGEHGTAQTPTITAQPVGDKINYNAAMTLSVTAKITDEGLLSYQWYKNSVTSSEVGAALIEGATSANYVVPTNEAGTNYYYCIITNNNNHVYMNKSKSQRSDIVSVTVVSRLSGTVSITGGETATIGDTLTANTSDLVAEDGGDCGVLTYQWKRTLGKNSTDITGANNKEYTLSAMEDIGAVFAVTVTAANCTGSVTSAPTAAVLKKTLTASDFSTDLTAAYYNGKSHPVLVTGPTGSGTITIYYNGNDSIPTNAGTYAISVSLSASDIYNATSTNIILGNFIIHKKTPALADLNFEIPTNHVYNESAQGIGLVTGSNGLGPIQIKYNGDTTVPSSPGQYVVTADVADSGANYGAAKAIVLGNYTIAKRTLTPTDFTANFTGVSYDGKTHAVKVTGPTGSGVMTIHYNGGGVPTNAGTYAVSVSVAAGNTYAATTDDIFLGNFTIHKKTPTLADLHFEIPTNHVYNGSAQGIGSVTGINGLGSIEIKYNDNTTVPSSPGQYVVTADVADSGVNYGAAKAIVLGTYTILPANDTIAKRTLTSADFTTNFTDVSYDGKTHAVQVTGPTGSGAITILYNGSGAPTNAGTYAISVNAAEGDTYAATTDDILLGSFTIHKKTPVLADLKYTIPKTHVYNFAAKGIGSVTSNAGLGRITVKYNGQAAVPRYPGVYIVTADIADSGKNYSAASRITLGKYTIIKANHSTPAKPQLYRKTHDTITLKAVAGMEYSKNGVTWQNSAVFKKLQKNKKYSFYMRRKATTTHNVSAKSSKLEVVTLKGVTKKLTTSAVPKNKKVKKGAAITLKAPKGTILYYTTNGKTPTTSIKSKINSGKKKLIKIKKTTKLRVIAVKKGYMPSKEVKRTYRVK